MKLRQGEVEIEVPVPNHSAITVRNEPAVWVTVNANRVGLTLNEATLLLRAALDAVETA